MPLKFRRVCRGFSCAGILFAAAMLCSCGNGGLRGMKTASSQSFVFDTYSVITVNGGNAENTLAEINAVFKDMSEAFELCYGTDAANLPENGFYTDCAAKTDGLNKLYGDKVNIYCGALTKLWGISTDEPHVPSDEEIAEALTKITPENEGMMYDFGAVAKGYACDKAYKYLSGTDTDYAAVSLMSSTLLYGEKPRGEKFRAGIIDPLTGRGYMGFIGTEAAFLSTSGGYERYFEADGKKYSHILDMNTGRPVETDLISVTVVVPADTPDGGIMSDFLATLIYTEGSGELDKWLENKDFRLVAVTDSGAVYSNCEGFYLNESDRFYYGKR